MHTAHYLGLGAMNLNTDTGSGESGSGGPSAGSGVKSVFVRPAGSTTPKPSFFDVIKQALTPPPRVNTTVFVAPPRTNTVVPVIRAGSGQSTIFTPPSPTQVTLTPPPGPIPQQGVVCIIPIVNVRAGGPGYAMVSCATKGSKQVSLAEALRLTGGGQAPPPTNYDPPAGRPPPVIIPGASGGGSVPVQQPPASVPDATPAETAAGAITASSQTAQTVANLPAVQTDLPPPGAMVVETAPLPVYKRKGFLIGAGVLAVAGGIAAAVYGQSH
jgi:hypothetical protein